MGRLGLIVIILLLSSVVYAGAIDSTAVFMARSVYEQLGMDTTGTASLPVALAREYARDGIFRAGSDIGIEASKSVTVSANTGSALLDTQVIRIAGVSFDSLSITRRWLIPVPYDSINRFSGDITATRNGQRYALFCDSLLIGPVSSGSTVYGVRYFKRANYQADTSTVTNVPMEHRDAAIQWACALASQRLQNGRVDEFLKMYDYMVAKAWQKRQ